MNGPEEAQDGPKEAKDENVREMMTVEMVESYIVDPQMAMKINNMLADTEAETKVKSITPVTMTCLKCEEYGEKQHEYTIAIVVYQKVLTKEIWEQLTPKRGWDIPTNRESNSWGS